MGCFIQLPAYLTIKLALNGPILATLVIVAWDEKLVEATLLWSSMLEDQVPRWPDCRSASHRLRKWLEEPTNNFPDLHALLVGFTVTQTAQYMTVLASNDCAAVQCCDCSRARAQVDFALPRGHSVHNEQLGFSSLLNPLYESLPEGNILYEKLL